MYGIQYGVSYREAGKGYLEFQNTPFSGNPENFFESFPFPGKLKIRETGKPYYNMSIKKEILWKEGLKRLTK